MTRATVTGASGLVGANLLRSLLDRGIEVCAADLRRSPALDGLDVDFVEVNVRDRSSLAAAFDGADVVFHLAAMISIVGDPTGEVRKVNVEGPANVANAARDAGVERVVHCSSVHAFDLEKCGPSLDETGPRTIGEHAPAYDRSKYAGEQALLKAAGDDLDVVIVNPTGVIGPHDYAPSRIGETILELRDRKIPVNVAGGFDFVDVREVVNGLIAAWEHGRRGENYLLSGTRITLKELGQLVAGISGTRAPRFDVPLSLLTPLGPLVMKLTPRTRIPLFTPDSLHALRFAPSVSHFKAATELGYRVRPIHETVADTLKWFADQRR
ncbi:MAG: NAD-dependent epimerase/dehydratase family protein [Candidatus Microthrix sp.]|nr:NAD-dependent epimerase/dehydratase family protein [Candidatus Microthrix sp.]MBK6312489.1 NAD-dependent epimerase/dehydratase family protein [Candidatus Microthrix sp.]MBK9561465.1 NAD-dependent epimerase/dehydratase family protein [Candidatus Microthrix sp.]